MNRQRRACVRSFALIRSVIARARHVAQSRAKNGILISDVFFFFATRFGLVARAIRLLLAYWNSLTVSRDLASSLCALSHSAKVPQLQLAYPVMYIVGNPSLLVSLALSRFICATSSRGVS